MKSSLRWAFPCVLFGCGPMAPSGEAPVQASVEACVCPPADPAASLAPTRIAVRDVELVLPEGLLRVRYLDGIVQGAAEGRPPAIDDPKGYRIVVDRAEVAVDLRTLNAMMSADHGAPGKKAPLASAEFTTEGGLLVVTGKKPVPFVLKGAASVDAEGRMTISVVELKALGVQTKGLLDVLHLKLEDLIDVTNERGVTIDGNVVHVDPLTNLPPPGVEAKITGVAVEADGLVLRLGDTGTTQPETPSAATARSAADTPGTFKNYLSYTGGTVVQGRLTIRDAALQLVDLDPTDPLRIAIETVGEQIAHGYTKMSAAGEMTTYIPDANGLEEASAAPPSG